MIFVAQGVLNTLHYVFYLDLESVLHFNPLRAGLAFLPISVFAVLGSARLLPFLLERFGLRATLAVGLLGVAGSTALLAAGMAGGSFLTMVPGGRSGACSPAWCTRRCSSPPGPVSRRTSRVCRPR